MRRDDPVDGRIIEYLLCADPDEQNAGSRAIRSEVRRRQYGRPTRVGDVALTVARRVEVCGVRRMI